jgi:hypothetical protein
MLLFYQLPLGGILIPALGQLPLSRVVLRLQFFDLL